MGKLRLFLKKFKVTVMVIPNADQNIKQKNINLAFILLVLLVLILINLVLMFTSITSRFKANALTSENRELVSEMTYKEDRINTLANLNESNEEEIDTLKTTLSSSADYLAQRLEEIDAADEKIETLVAMFNTETNSNLDVPVSRSFDRTASYNSNLLAGSEQITTSDTDSQDILSDISLLLEDEAVSDIISDKTDAYDDLISNLENQLLYLDCRPDLVPAEGSITSTFGYRIDPVYGGTAKHNGIDFANETDTPIYAAGSGIVTYAAYNSSFGNLVIIDHGYGYKSVYGHCNSLNVEAGQEVEKGDFIAKMGSTGKSTGTHLHFEIRYNDNPINPATILNLE